MTLSVDVREESHRFGIHMQQLTLPYLLKGYYPKHSFLVALGCLTFSTALLSAAPSHWPSHVAPHNAAKVPPPPVLFYSFTAFVAGTVFGIMALTGLYRTLVNNKNASTHACDAELQTDFLVDVLLKGTVQCVVHTLLEGSTRSRAGLIAGVSIVAELGKLLKSTPAVLVLLSLVWIGYLAYSHCLPESMKARCSLLHKEDV